MERQSRATTARRGFNNCAGGFLLETFNAKKDIFASVFVQFFEKLQVTSYANLNGDNLLVKFSGNFAFKTVSNFAPT